MKKNNKFWSFPKDKINLKTGLFKLTKWTQSVYRVAAIQLSYTCCVKKRPFV